jgi:RNA-directed DNA polymerase
MAQDGQEMLGRDEQKRLVTALRVALMRCQEKGIDGTLWRDMLYPANLGLVPENLEWTRNLLKATIGYDPLEGDTRPKGEKQQGLARSEAREAPSLQDLRRKIYIKAKAEKAWRFWGLYVHVCKMETLREAYRLAKENDGAPGIDGVTFEAIEAGGVEAFLEQIRDELVTRRYRPMRNRKKEIPKDGGKKVRVLSIPAIRDRVVQGALKLILEAIFEADFQPGSFGYRPKRSPHEAVHRVAVAITQEKTRVIDLDLRAYFDNVRHHILLEKVARRVKDDEILHLLKMILKASGKKGVPQGGVISPLLSNIYLDEVDRMLEKAKEVTRTGKYTHIEYARFADDLVVLVDAHPRHDWLLKKVEERLREELAKLQVDVNEEKTRIADLTKGESFGFLGFDFRRVRSLRGKWQPLYIPKIKKRTELLRKLKGIFRRFVSQPIRRVVELINPVLRGWVNYFRYGNSSRCFSFVRQWVAKKMRRHLRRAQMRRGFGWKRWSSAWLYRELGLFDGYRVQRWTPRTKALPCQ